MENPVVRVGDVVRLRSGGIAMTVVETELREGEMLRATCAWLTNNGEQGLQVYPDAALDLLHDDDGRASVRRLHDTQGRLKRAESAYEPFHRSSPRAG